jgi:hypothetical protein
MNKRRGRGWRPFEEAREYVRGLGLRNLSEWLAWAKSEARPGLIPANPSVIYKHRGWVDIGDWLGIDNVSGRGGNWEPFEEAREFIQSLGLKNYKNGVPGLAVLYVQWIFHRTNDIYIGTG